MEQIIKKIKYRFVQSLNLRDQRIKLNKYKIRNKTCKSLKKWKYRGKTWTMNERSSQTFGQCFFLFLCLFFIYNHKFAEPDYLLFSNNNSPSILFMYVSFLEKDSKVQVFYLIRFLFSKKTTLLIIIFCIFWGKKHVLLINKRFSRNCLFAVTLTKAFLTCYLKFYGWLLLLFSDYSFGDVKISRILS